MRRIRLFRDVQWLRSPSDRAIIARWSPQKDDSLPLARRHRLELPETFAPPTDATWEFLALGDTGDADASGPFVSPQDAVGRELANDTMPPVGLGQGRFVLHTGDVIYMAGERRLYERNFRRPYAAFLTSECTVDDLIFRVPFLPVPGNHDYYDLHGWANWLGRVPLVSKGLRALAHEFLGFPLPEGGSDQGRVFMEAFVRPQDKATTDAPTAYIPGQKTRLPHRYYQFTLGNVDVFALDSNTLDAPPTQEDVSSVLRQRAKERKAALDREMAALEVQLKQEQQSAEMHRQTEREKATRPEGRTEILILARTAENDLINLLNALPSNKAEIQTTGNALNPRLLFDNMTADWQKAVNELETAPDETTVRSVFERLDTLGDQVCDAISALGLFLATLPVENPLRQQITALSDAIQQSQARWSAAVQPATPQSQERIQELTHKILDIQREMALEEQRQHYQSEDFDFAQLAWLEAALTTAETERPDNWRIVFLHHPIYTTIQNHAERSDVRGLRDNLLAVLQKPGRVHLILSGHSHAFEWISAAALPHAGLFVTGGGGQVALHPSVFSSHNASRYYRERVALREAGVRECATAGSGPNAADGESGPLYHYLRIQVTATELRVIPVGVRRLQRGHFTERRFRREEPMPVYHNRTGVPGGETPVPRLLKFVAIHRDRPPEPHWK